MEDEKKERTVWGGIGTRLGRFTTSSVGASKEVGGVKKVGFPSEDEATTATPPSTNEDDGLFGRMTNRATTALGRLRIRRQGSSVMQNGTNNVARGRTGSKEEEESGDNFEGGDSLTVGRNNRNNSQVKTRRPRGESVFALSSAQQAFLPRAVRLVLQGSVSAPKVPMLQKEDGVVLFVDISGFTALGRKLRGMKGATPMEAAEQLAKRINLVLRRLTTECQIYGGDIAKFAGDALICVWSCTVEDIPRVIEKSKRCAISMLNAVKEIDSELDLHGGIASGGLMHVHLGDTRSDKLRWYLITGEAVVAATSLVEKAPRGNFLCMPHQSSGVEQVDLNMPPETLTADSKGVEGRERNETVFAGSPKFENQNIVANPHGIAYIPQGLKASLKAGHDEPEMRRRVAVVFSSLPDLTATKEELSSRSIAVDRLFDLNEVFNSLVAIVHKFDGEVRDLLFDDKGCVFIAVFGAHKAIEMPELKAAKAGMSIVEELDNVKVGISVGTCFVGLCGNESRHDLVVMGHEVNMAARFMGKAELNTVLVSHSIKYQTETFFKYEEIPVVFKKTAFDHNHDLDGSVARELERKSMNIDAMKSSAAAGSNTNDNNNHSLPSPTSKRVSTLSENTIPETSTAIVLSDTIRTKRQRKPPLDLSVSDPNGKCIAFRPVQSIRLPAEDIALYRFDVLLNGDSEIFVGRTQKLKVIDTFVTKMSKDQTSGLILITGEAGMGKSALIRQIRRSFGDKYKIFLGAAFALDLDTRFYIFRQLLESMFGISEDILSADAKSISQVWDARSNKINYEHMEEFLPYMRSLLERDSVKVSSMKTQGSTRKTFTRSLMASFRGSMSQKNLSSSTTAAPATNNTNAGSVASTSSAAGASLDESPQSNTSDRKHAPSLSTTNTTEEAGKHSIPPISPKHAGATTGTSSPVTGTRKATLKKAGDASNAARKMHEEQNKKKTRKRRSRGPDTNNILSSTAVVNLTDTFQAFVEIAASISAEKGKKATVLILEDLQWMDIPSLQILEEIEKRCSSGKFVPGVTFILTSRPMKRTDQDPGEQHANTQNMLRNLILHNVFETCKGKKSIPFSKSSNSNHAHLFLRNLSKANVSKIVQLALQHNPNETVSKELMDVVFDKTDGFVLHVVVTLNSLIDNQALDIDSNGVIRLKNKFFGTDVVSESEVSAAIIAKFDSLTQDVRNVLKIAACLGQKFYLEDVHGISVADAEHHRGAIPEEKEIAKILEIAAKENLIKRTFYGYVWNYKGLQNNIKDLVPSERKIEILKVLAETKTTAGNERAAEMIQSYHL